MATAMCETTVPADLDGCELNEKLKQSDQAISEAWVGLTKQSLLIGWEGHFIKRHNGWERLGFADEKSYRASKGIARSTWYKMVGLAERFEGLDRDDFLAMSIENAEQLAAAPRSVRENREMLRAAASQTAREFEGELVRVTAERECKAASEIYVTIKWRIKQAQREVIERGLEDWQHEHGIDDPGFALELMVAEYRERATLAGFIQESIVRLTREVTRAETIEDLRALRGVFAQHIAEMGEILRVVCGEPGGGERAA
jgi:hypothetical protein